MKKLNGIAAVVAFLVTTIFNQVTGQFTTSSPGNVHSTSLKAWYSADNYTPNSSIWQNTAKNNNSYNLSSVYTDVPRQHSTLWNYNPTLSFEENNANDHFRAEISEIKSILDKNEGTIMAVANHTGNGNGGVTGYFNSTSRFEEFSIQSKSVYFRSHPNPVNWYNIGEAHHLINKTPLISIAEFDSDNKSLKAYSNAILSASDDFRTGPLVGRLSNEAPTFSPFQRQFSIGRIPTGADFSGSIAEVIYFGKVLGDAERLRTESYLAIKYSQTLGSISNTVNYKASNGADIWQADSKYQNNIIGIGRDDISLLNQKQSHQMDDVVRLYLDKIHTTNQENNGTFSKDRSFVLMGSNEDKLHATDASNTEMFAGLAYSTSCHLFSVIERNWKVQRTNMTDRFNIDIRLSDSAKLHQINPAHLRLVVDDDNDLSNGWVGCYGINDDGLNIVYANGEVSFKGISTYHIPNDAILYITIGSISDGTPLPVGLTEFSSQCDQRKVYLNWTTETETNNDYFTLEKSSDGQHFEPMAFITGQGSKSTATEYNHTDHNALSGISYYRLSQTDYDGTHRVSKTISSNCESDLAITFHPNPTKDGVFVSLNGKTEEALIINVFNLFGQHISTHYINGSDWIDLPNTNGIYLMKYTLNGIQSTEKIVKY